VRFVLLASALFAFDISALAVDRYVTYHYGADTGLYTQTIWTAFHGFYNQVEHNNHFMVHFSPIYYAIAPILAALPSPLTLQVIQAIACALTAPPIYLIARKRVDERLAVLIAVIVLLYPPLFSLSLSEFHENAFAPAAIAWLLWAVDERRWAWAAFFAALALSIKEDEALILAVLGIGFAIVSARRHDRAAAVFSGSVALAAVAILVLYFGVIQPMTGGRWFVADFYVAHTADLPHGVAAITGRLTFLLEAFGPLLFLPLGSPVILLAVPGLFEVLSSRWPVTYTMGTHYAGVWIAYVLVAFAFTLARIAQENPQRALVLARLSLTLCVLNLIVASPTHWAHYYRLRNQHDASLDRIIALVPANAFGASFGEAYTHMSLSPNARIGMYETPDYFVYDSHYDGATYLADIVPRLAAVVCTGYFVPIARDDGVTLFKRLRPVPDEVYVRAKTERPQCLHSYQ
jgi:uncharacterized membrane protein